MGEFQPINTQEELDKVLSSRLQRERDTVSKTFQAQIEERDTKIAGFESTIKDLNKPIETLNGQTGRIPELEAKVREYETASAKTRIALEMGLPYEMAGRLSGSTEEEIRKAVAQTALRRLAKCEHDKQKAATILKNLGYGTETKV